MAIRIGYGDPDRLVSYPDARCLSGCSLPIRMLLAYPGVADRCGCSLPVRVLLTDAGVVDRLGCLLVSGPCCADASQWLELNVSLDRVVTHQSRT